MYLRIEAAVSGAFAAVVCTGAGRRRDALCDVKELDLCAVEKVEVL